MILIITPDFVIKAKTTPCRLGFKYTTKGDAVNVAENSPCLKVLKVALVLSV